MFMFFEELRDGSWLNGWDSLSFLFEHAENRFERTENVLVI